MPLQRFPAWSNHMARGWRRGSAARTTTTNTDNITHAHRYVSRFNVYHTGSNTWAHAKSFSLIIIIIKVHHHHHHQGSSSSSSSRFIIIIIIIKVHHHHHQGSSSSSSSSSSRFIIIIIMCCRHRGLSSSLSCV